ncbi:putative disease resistance protein RGA3 isoform X2 [Papaver somniferum]|uniref:putative disease resistance protein RGA3 isoform X2 n=1 Tax=Papaver somniferum TaxID=3469 RepID=UPI000E6F4A7E|nr:putative disease resistance protein RGA3 isoform X2 [Papaver somniferum]
MDEFCYETMRRCERGSQLKHKVRDFISKSSNPLVFHFKMAGKLRDIKKKLDEIYNDSVRYTLNATSGASRVDQTKVQCNRLTTSVVDDSVLIGMEDARSDIVNMLTNKTLTSVSPSSSSSHNSSHQEKLSVVSIVGMGGLGKTSLAQLVYRDESIKTHFDKKMCIWVCVSDKLDVYRILKEIIESITDCSCGDLSNVDVLARQVKEKLIGKKYLLVLDDLWNEDAADWEKLKGVLVNGVEGSRFLVTTRSQKVASVIGDIARDVAKKCDGLPLAANFLGSLLYLKREESYWVSINDDKNLWVQPENKRVIPILKLSYDNLASPLKLCFSNCCLFPKDWEIEREILIRVWMAEGFLQSSTEVNSRSFEDIGNDYFEFLLWNSFFQNTWQDELGVIRTCRMHDLVHDLAMSVVDCNEFGIGKKEDVSQVRHLQLICDGSSSTAEVLSKAKNLRTVVVLHPNNSPEIGSFPSAKHLRILYPLGLWDPKFAFSVSMFTHLRFLDLSNCEFNSSRDVSLNHSHNLQTLILRSCLNVSWFLGETGHLKNLRHLDVSKSDIKVLPDDSIVNLTNLQTLDLRECRQFEALPENIGLFKHLSYINLSSSSIRKIPDSITCITNLRTLNFAGCRNLDALPTELGALTRLRCLDFSGSEIKVLPESCITNLCNLEIVDFGIRCELPEEIKNWPKLRQFRHFRNSDDEIMTRGMEKLTCLETLRSYMARKEADIQVCGCTQNNCSSGHSGIEELAALNSLQVLHIECLENVRGGIEDAERAKLKDKTNLRELCLNWSPDEDYEDGEDCGDGHEDSEDGEDCGDGHEDSEDGEDCGDGLEDSEDCEDGEDDEECEDCDLVLEGLQPPPNLRSLHIFGFRVSSFRNG